MAGLSSSVEMRGQFVAIARVRWQLFKNGLRTLNGRLELVARGFAFLGFGALSVGGATGLGVAAYFLISQGKAGWIAVLLWPVFLFWQFFPVIASAFTENVDSSNLLRFPLTYPSYFTVRLAYGSLDPSTIVGCVWLVGLAVGIGVASLSIFFWAILVLLVFAIFNILLARMIFVWLERWLAQRRTREILGVVFFIFIISFQFIAPLINHYSGRKHSDVSQAASQILPFERALPPGLAALSIAQAVRGNFGAALGAFAIECAYGLVILWLLNIRLRAQYRGENLSEGVARAKTRVDKKASQVGWDVPVVSQPIAAILEKEFRYLLRSGPVLFTLLMPVVILLIFRISPSSSGRQGQLFTHAPDFAFPIGAAYALLILTNIFYNSFGADNVGIQFFFVAPVRFREVLLGKNLAHSLILVVEMILVWLGVCFLYRPPSPNITMATIAGMAFALLVNLSGGNLFSMYAPKKIDYGAFGKQKASPSAVFTSLAIQAVVCGLGAVTLLAARAYGRLWLATLIFSVLAAFALVGYLMVLNRADKITLDRRDQILSELCRA